MRKGLIQSIDTCKSEISLCLTENTIFGQIWSKKSILLVKAEIWQLDWFEYIEFKGDVQFFPFLTGYILFWQIWSQNSKFFLFKVKLGNQRNSSMQNSVAIFNFFCFPLEISCLGKFGPKIKTVSLSWNLVYRLIPICQIQLWFLIFLISTRNIIFS